MPTVPQRLREALAGRSPKTLKELSAELSVAEKELVGALEKLALSLRHEKGKLLVQPAYCLACGFEFESRQRLTKPSRCPSCRSERIAPPRYGIERRWSPRELTLGLEQLGVRRGDTLMVHASLRKLGPTEGGANGVLDALEAAVGESGTLLMVLGAVVDHEWVNQRPEAERAALLENLAPYEPLAAPALPEVGYLAEAFRTRPGTLVDPNPSGRFGARGQRAQELLRNLPWNDYYGPGSALHRLCQLGGRVLRLGANPDTTTVLHYAEYVASVNDKRRVRRHYRVHGADGPETTVIECLDDEHGIVEWEGEDYFALTLKAYLETGRALRGRVGAADAELIDAADLVAFGAAWMSEHLGA
jgi:aminoglycoside N3'-acetyltransferase/predicted Zn-ribbon and HTH transcriptional regulator